MFFRLKKVQIKLDRRVYIDLILISFSVSYP